MIGRVYELGGNFWRVVARGEPFDTRRGGPARNVLLERVLPTSRTAWWPTGERMVRPFRGLRRQ